jgi:hypothetical protein
MFGGTRSWPNFNVLPLHSPGETEENHKDLNQNSPSLGSRFEAGTSRIRVRSDNHWTTTFGEGLSVRNIACFAEFDQKDREPVRKTQTSTTAGPWRDLNRVNLTANGSATIPLLETPLLWIPNTKVTRVRGKWFKDIWLALSPVYPVINFTIQLSFAFINATDVRLQSASILRNQCNTPKSIVRPMPSHLSPECKAGCDEETCAYLGRLKASNTSQTKRSDDKNLFQKQELVIICCSQISSLMEQHLRKCA